MKRGNWHTKESNGGNTRLFFFILFWQMKCISFSCNTSLLIIVTIIARSLTFLQQYQYRKGAKSCRSRIKSVRPSIRPCFHPLPSSLTIPGPLPKSDFSGNICTIISEQVLVLAFEFGLSLALFILFFSSFSSSSNVRYDPLHALIEAFPR